MKLPLTPSTYHTLPAIANYLRQLADAIASGWKVEHNDDGTHQTGPRCKAYLSSGQTVADATMSRVVLDTIVYDNFNEFDPARGLWTASEDMEVIVLAGLFIANANTGAWYVALNHDKTSTGGTATNIVSYSVDTQHTASTVGRQIHVALHDVERGHSIALFAEQHTGGNQTVGAGKNSTWMAIQRTK
jgi:hypothetical protein